MRHLGFVVASPQVLFRLAQDILKVLNRWLGAFELWPWWLPVLFMLKGVVLLDLWPVLCGCFTSVVQARI